MEDHNYHQTQEKFEELLSMKLRQEKENLEKTKVYLGDAFARWTSLKRDKSFRSDAELACFLLDSYERPATTSAPTKEKPVKVKAPAGSGTNRANSYERTATTSAPTKEKPVQVKAPAGSGTNRANSYERTATTSAPTKEKPVQVKAPAGSGTNRANSYERAATTSAPTKEKPVQVKAPAGSGTNRANSYERTATTSAPTKEKPVQLKAPAGSGANRANSWLCLRTPNGVVLPPAMSLQPADPRVINWVVVVPSAATSGLKQTQVRRAFVGD
ncbi:uncharacterized protein LOC115798769 isoform X2 [Archocentrus centrarchus]|uniref:uncharacterized protein LOC115798769 isoform X2 n=1 Tax=Archocentrus centrarchus TaxID=63155 RepID=UPI0011EA0AFB|nr:uncharacterized protein LOC115798769 isoform X2 [Archocentrus centrarchus]